MNTEAEIPDLAPSEWYFLDCPKDQVQLCAYYEYARSSPTMKRAIKNVHEAVYDAVTILPRPKYVAFLTDQFPKEPWLGIPKYERRRITHEIAQRRPPPDLVYRRLLVDREDDIQWPPDFPELGPAIIHDDDNNVTTALIQVHWSRGNEELKEAFQSFLTKHRLHGTGPRQGRIKSDFDHLNSLGAKRLMDRCARLKATHVAKAAFDEMKKQVDGSEGKMRLLYGNPSALALAARNAKKHLLELYGVAVDRRLEVNQLMSEEEIEALGPNKPWFPGIYLEDPADFG